MPFLGHGKKKSMQSLLRFCSIKTTSIREAETEHTLGKDFLQEMEVNAKSHMLYSLKKTQ